MEFLCYNLSINRRMLKTIKERCIKKGMPIGSHNARGYFLIRTQEDCDMAKANYLKQAHTELTRAKQIDENFENTYRRLNLFERENNAHRTAN